MSLQIHLPWNFFDRTIQNKDIDHMALDGLLITTTIPRYRSRKNKFARSKIGLHGGMGILLLYGCEVPSMLI